MLKIAESANQVHAWMAEHQDFHLIGFFGDFSAASWKAKPAFMALAKEHEDVPALLVDVAQVRGVHKQFGVSAVPSVLGLERGRVLQKVEGVRDVAGYDQALLTHASVSTGSNGSEAPRQPRVVVYTGPHCSWCTRVKNYLRQQRVRFTEIDVGSDPSAARALVARTGQQGVPQLDIGGQYVVGFDKARIDRLLNLSGGHQAA